MVLAAGLGTRMRPYNGHVPKPLVQIRGKSLIDYSLDRLADAGVERAVVNVHYLADALESHSPCASGRRSSFPTSARIAWHWRRHRQGVAAAWRRAVLSGQFRYGVA